MRYQGGKHVLSGWYGFARNCTKKLCNSVHRGDGTLVEEICTSRFVQIRCNSVQKRVS